MKKYLTNIKNNIYLKESNVKLKKFKYEENDVIKVYLNKEITDFLGFGGAITEASGYNYSKLSIENKKRFIADYYSENGLNYNWGRVSIASNDFCLSSYECSEKKDLSDFNIERDKKYIIPLLKDILKEKKLTLIASPWSPPKMYKSIKSLYLGCKLKEKYYDSYSDYLIKWLDSYKNENINIDYITMQNEPLARQRWESCVFNLEEQKKFIYNNLLPKLKDTKLLLWDHNKEMLYDNFEYLYKENDKIAGVAFHYYSGSHFNNLKMIREKYPEILMINTEMCCGYKEYNEKDWISDAEWYMKDIFGDLNNGVNAYLDWNIILDKKGGPTHKNNFVNSPILLDNEEFIKTPIYYYLYHISHFVNNGYKLVENSKYTDNLDVLSFKKDNNVVVVICNRTGKKYKYNLFIENNYIADEIDEHSIITYSI